MMTSRIRLTAAPLLWGLLLAAVTTPPVWGQERDTAAPARAPRDAEPSSRIVRLAPPGPERTPLQRPAELPAPTPLPDPFGFESSESFEPEVIPTREQIIARAVTYAEHAWTPTAANLQHGTDPAGVHVDTPDASYWDEDGFEVGTTYAGLPYQWGGFASIEMFDEGLAAGRYAGHVFKEWDPENRPDMSFYAVGLDCSGFVSRCWELPRKQSTRSLPYLCRELSDSSELLPGDLINKANQHCLLFAGWHDEERTKVLIYESTFPRVRSQVYTWEKLQAAGYQPLRWKALEAADAARAAEPARAEDAAGAPERSEPLHAR